MEDFLGDPSFELAFLTGARLVPVLDAVEGFFRRRHRAGEEAIGSSRGAQFEPVVVIGGLEHLSILARVAKLAGGCDARHLFDSEDLSETVESSEKQSRRRDFIESLRSQSHFAIAALHSLKARDEEYFRRLGLDDPTGSDGELEDVGRLAVHLKRQNKFAFLELLVGAPQTHLKNVVVRFFFEKDDAAVQNAGKDRPGKDIAQTPIVAQETFRTGPA